MSDEMVVNKEAQQADVHGDAGGALFAAHQKGVSGVAALASNAEVTAVMASIYVAKQFPRDLAEVTAAMNLCCSHLSLAQKAMYSFTRGGSVVDGASIRLAEALLSVWGNAECGWREVCRRLDVKSGKMVSECQAFAYDKQTNVRHEIMFSVPHWRDTSKGGYALKDERDIYELCANMAARRRRACILAILPGWLVDEALERVNETLEKSIQKKSLQDLLRSMEARFLEFGVSRRMLEANLGHSIEECTRAEVVRLGKVFTSIADGAVRVRDVFPQEEVRPEVRAAEVPIPPAPAASAAPKAPDAVPGGRGGVRVAAGGLFDDEDEIPM